MTHLPRCIRVAHVDPHTGQANRMPLFCTLVERFLQARLHNGRWNYSWQQMEEDLASNDRLLRWWTKHQAMFTTQEPGPEEPALGAQQHPEAPACAEPYVGGWAHREAAHAWGEQLLAALLMGGYQAAVRVHLEKQWYQLILVDESGAQVLQTPLQVQFLIEQARGGTLCRDGSRTRHHAWMLRSLRDVPSTTASSNMSDELGWTSADTKQRASGRASTRAGWFSDCFSG